MAEGVWAMHDLCLGGPVAAALARSRGEALSVAPALGARVWEWMVGLSPSDDPKDYFLHPSAFPMFAVPWWVEMSLGVTPDDATHVELTYSTANGYYYIRLIDDVMDGDAGVDPCLLPALNLFSVEFIRPYQRYFPADHPFWSTFRSIWFKSAEAAMIDARLDTLDERAFRQVAAKKVCAAKLPIAAVLFRNGRADLLEPWSAFVDGLGAWHQMGNDLFDWNKDRLHGQSTYLLSHAVREKGAGESIASWITRAGFAWACNTMETWLAELLQDARSLASPEAEAYLRQRGELFAGRRAGVEGALAKIGRLLDVLS